jgi:hypothetical protein
MLAINSTNLKHYDQVFVVPVAIQTSTATTTALLEVPSSLHHHPVVHQASPIPPSFAVHPRMGPLHSLAAPADRAMRWMTVTAVTPAVVSTSTMV